MPASLEQLTADALTLPDKSRATLAQRLIESLPEDEIAPVGDGYFLTGDQLAEIRRRMAQTGGPELLTQNEFFDRLGAKA